MGNDKIMNRTQYIAITVSGLVLGLAFISISAYALSALMQIMNPRWVFTWTIAAAAPPALLSPIAALVIRPSRPWLVGFAVGLLAISVDIAFSLSAQKTAAAIALIEYTTVVHVSGVAFRLVSGMRALRNG